MAVKAGRPGRGEIWRSLDTTDRKDAGLLRAKMSAQFDRDWKHRLQAAKAVGGTFEVDGVVLD
jgi:hypothetical protein